MQSPAIHRICHLAPCGIALGAWLGAVIPAAAQAALPVGEQFQVNSYTTSVQAEAALGLDADNDFIVTWTSTGSAGTDSDLRSIQAQRFASDGSVQGAQFQVNTYTTSGQYWSSVAATADGVFVVAWESSGSPGTDSSYQSVQAQRYRAPIVAPALSPSAISVLGAALLLIGVSFMRAYGSVSRRSRFSR
jgi:hypothetical protein